MLRSSSEDIRWPPLERWRPEMRGRGQGALVAPTAVILPGEGGVGSTRGGLWARPQGGRSGHARGAVLCSQTVHNSSEETQKMVLIGRLRVVRPRVRITGGWGRMEVGAETGDEQEMPASGGRWRPQTRECQSRARVTGSPGV